MTDDIKLCRRGLHFLDKANALPEKVTNANGTYIVHRCRACRAVYMKLYWKRQREKHANPKT